MKYADDDVLTEFHKGIQAFRHSNVDKVGYSDTQTTL
jgi:hypothetical protein